LIRKRRVKVNKKIKKFHLLICLSKKRRMLLRNWTIKDNKIKMGRVKMMIIVSHLRRKEDQRKRYLNKEN
jgi:hypothetical protein